jgi:hypothetical protein
MESLCKITSKLILNFLEVSEENYENFDRSSCSLCQNSNVRFPEYET